MLIEIIIVKTFNNRNNANEKNKGSINNNNNNNNNNKTWLATFLGQGKLQCKTRVGKALYPWLATFQLFSAKKNLVRNWSQVSLCFLLAFT